MALFGDCKCLPGRERHAILFAMQDIAEDYEKKANDIKLRVEEHPEIAKKTDEFIQADERFKKGLVTARDLAGDYVPSHLLIEHFERESKFYHKIYNELRDVPACGS